MTFTPLKNSIPEKPPAKRTPLSERVLSQLEAQAVTPSPRWHFLCIEYIVWLLWAVTVVAGAIAVAVMLFVGTHARFELYEATHETPLSFIVEILPILWISLFLCLIAVAYFELRRTKRGYRYPFSQIILSSIIFSFAGGMVMHWFGVGYLIEKSISRAMPMYPSYERVELRLWQTPDEGRLVGKYVPQTDRDMMYFTFIDVASSTWEIDGMELSDADVSLLREGVKVRLIGTTTDATTKKFHACGVFPWMLEKPMPVRELAARRDAFVDKMHTHQTAKKRLEEIETQLFAATTVPAESHYMRTRCGDIAIMRRFQFASE